MGGRATNHKPRRHRKVLEALIRRKEGSRLVPGRVRGLTRLLKKKGMKRDSENFDHFEIKDKGYRHTETTLQRYDNDVDRCSVAVWSLESCHTDSSPATNDPEVPCEDIAESASHTPIQRCQWEIQRRNKHSNIVGEQIRSGSDCYIQNLSSTDMTLLQKGLIFCPVPHFDTFQVDQELHRFFRTLRLKVHFSNTPFETTPDLTKTSSGFSLKSLGLRTSSSFQPPKTYHPVETFIEVVNRDVKEILGSIDKGLVKVKNNLSREEYRSLMDLKNNRNLIIKPADKGGAIVVLDRTYYINEILSQLNDTNTYMPVSNNPTFEIGRQISNLVSHYLSLGVIDQKLGDFLINHHPVIPVLYTLPKIHKDLLRPPGRPIVASTNSVLSPLAITVEKILSPLVPFMKSYLKDTTHFLQLLRDLGPLPSNSILVTMDVSSLYTNIDHQEGLESVTKYVTTYANFSDNQLQFCIDALTIILTKNYFLFEDQFYVQKKGTAMGSNVAPPFANIFIDFYETSYVYCHPLFSSNVIFWRHFIDDVFFIWTGDAEALRGFHADLNSSTPNITFSLQYSDQSINFLDTLVITRSGGIVETDLYVKSTDRNSLLSYTSNHPRHVKKALPKSQHDRIRRIVSNPVQRTMRHMEMDRKFHDRGYPPTLDGNIGAQNINVTATPKQPRIAFTSFNAPHDPVCLGSCCLALAAPGPDKVGTDQNPDPCHKTLATKVGGDPDETQIQEAFVDCTVVSGQERVEGDSQVLSIPILQVSGIGRYLLYRNSDTEFRYFCDIGNRYRSVRCALGTIEDTFRYLCSIDLYWYRVSVSARSDILPVSADTIRYRYFQISEGIGRYLLYWNSDTEFRYFCDIGNRNWKCSQSSSACATLGTIQDTFRYLSLIDLHWYRVSISAISDIFWISADLIRYRYFQISEDVSGSQNSKRQKFTDLHIGTLK
ncbi:unnamed protein product [Ranitomeya imitator]|uniref:Helix-turn-helix domain-containing protein n=1 Tax=Ranitomeya imitator TaxID=111125 RepID=A0ABN9MLY4_9NEOB|nr:unnamed protein product [Ranitomeya imitator]